MKSKKIDKFTIIAACVAFIIGSFVFTNLSTLNPDTDLYLHIEGIDTDLGVTTRSMSDGLAESDWSPDPSLVRVDPDKEGKQHFKIIGLVTLGLDIDRSMCGQPDIIVTVTNPRGPKPEIVGDPTDFTAPSGEQFKLYKTTFWVTLKTDADFYSADDVIAEIPTNDVGLRSLTSWTSDPPVGGPWEGNAYIEYGVRHIEGAFIYEALINQDPRVGIVTKDGLDTSLSLTAPAIQAQAHAQIAKMEAVSFYDSIEGNRVTDFVGVRTSRGILSLGGKLGVGADPQWEEHILMPDEFTGYNFFNVGIVYQVAVVVAVPYEHTVDLDGNPLDPTKVLTGSTESEDVGDPRYYDPFVEDKESEDIFEMISELLDKFFLIVIGIVCIAVIAVAYKFFSIVFRK